jgi:dynein heavy chain
MLTCLLFGRVAKVVAPKKAALQEAETEYSMLMQGLAAKKAELEAVIAALDTLNSKLAAMQVRCLILCTLDPKPNP